MQTQQRATSCTIRLQARTFVMAMAVLLATTIPARSETYKPDPSHSQIGFSVEHMGLVQVHGVFTDYTGSIEYTKGEMKSLKVDATIQVKSIDTRVQARDQHLRSADFFDAEQYPEIRFTADKAEEKDGQWSLVGTLTMHGTSKELKLPITLNGPINGQGGVQRIGLSARGVVNRLDFGVGSDSPAIGKNVSLVIDIEATQSN